MGDVQKKLFDRKTSDVDFHDSGLYNVYMHCSDVKIQGLISLIPFCPA